MKAIILDTETTGHNEPVAIEIAWLSLSDPIELKIPVSFEELYNPGKPSELGALATHHILDDELVDCKPSSTFRLPPETKYMIGHNIDYDWKVLGSPDVKRICTLAMARSLFPDIDSHTQSAMLYYFLGNAAKPLLKGAHSAFADVMNCHIVLRSMLGHISPVIRNWEELWLFSEEARLPKIMTFGKHKGEHIANIPSDYKRWLRNQPDIDPYLMKAIIHGFGK